ncbi:MAG: energy-coupled thiamine transporter ThiT [Bacilli bacterium]|nr:energy-coupled thiamine transporter ThiT [Bacilli bacterium]
MNKYTIRDITEIAIFSAIAIVLNLPVFKIHIASDAGSISFTMVPLFIIAIRHSWWKSLIASSVVYGLIACLTSGHGIITYPLDYALAYSGVVFISLMNKKILAENKMSYVYLFLTSLLAVLLRYIASTLSSIFIYDLAFVPALIYNAPYIFISGAIAITISLLLLKPLKIINQKYPKIKEIQ